MIRQLLQRALVGAVLSGVVRTAGAQQADAGTIGGRVTERGTGTPVPAAQVFVVGTGFGGTTDDAGAYRITGVPAGVVQVRVRRVGYESLTQSVTVSAGAVATADFAVGRAAAVLSQVTVTATGGAQQAREQGNVVSQVRPDSLSLAAVPNFSSLVQGRASGVNVTQSGGTTGSGARIRIRGANSVSLSNEPLIIIDGVRVTGTAAGNIATTLGVGGQEPSRLNDILPEEIENVEILKGPAATGLYGTQAANGVIQITTKKGQRGAPRWNFYAEGGLLSEVNDYPANFGGFGVNADGSETESCTLEFQALGECTIQNVASFNPLEDNSPFRTGSRQKYGLGVSGGTEAATYFLSGDYEGENGVYEVNNLDRINLRLNATARLRPDLNLAITTGYLTSRLGFPQNDNNILGVVSGGVLGTPVNNPETGGYYAVAPESTYRITTQQEANRYTAGLNGTWTPLGWLSVLATAGFDITNRDDNELIPPGAVAFADYPEGSRERNRFTLANYTANLSATANYGIREGVTGQTVAGVQFNREDFEGNFAYGARLLAGTGSLGGTTSRYAVNETNTDNRLIGGLVSQQIGFRDRVFITGALRGDQNSAFGENFGFAYYPSVQASWVVSEEGFFPRIDALTSLRLRSAYGQSGLRPSFRDAIQFFTPTAVTLRGQDEPGFTFGGVGNPNLKPERTSEWEGGFDASFWEDRLSLQATYFARRSTDALIQRRLAPSLGTGNGTGGTENPAVRFENLGAVTNKGLETQVVAQLFQTPRFGADVTVNYTTLANKLVTIGGGIEPILFGLGGDTQRHQEGYALGSYWQRPYTFADANSDGVITSEEVTIGDTAVYLGSILPKTALTVSPTVTLFRNLQLSALVDFRGGFKQYNATSEFRCSTIYNCEEIYVAGTPLADQARAIASQNGTVAGYIEDASFTKLREVALTLSLPEQWAGALGSRAASLTFAGRNLGLWTDYTGFDPEVNYAGQVNWSQAEFLSQPNVRYYTARVSLNF
jgi:TonB-dependent starch-binding outer membrane protein SusC